MDVWRITLAALRRWYVLFPLLALTALGTLNAGNGIQPEYEVGATAMLTPERVGFEIPNPYGGLGDANLAVTIVLNSVGTREEIADMGLIPSYEVGSQSRSSIMRLTIRGDTPELAEATGSAVLELARQELSTRQSDVGLPAESQYGLDVLEAPAVVSVVEEGKVRIQAVVGLVGASLALLAAVLFDDIIGIFKRSRDKKPGRRAQQGPLDDEVLTLSPGTGPMDISQSEMPRPERSKGGRRHSEGDQKPGSRRRAMRTDSEQAEPSTGTVPVEASHRP